jgi:hypothetical protein
VIGVGAKSLAREDKAYGPELKAVVGFAHRFRPTYPGFPVEVGGVEQLHAAFFERKPHTWSWPLPRSRKSGQRWCERGAPVRSFGTRIRLEGEACGFPHLAKNERDVGHPAIGPRIEHKSAFATGKSLAREDKGEE